MKKVKDVTAAAEKLRREKWIEEKTKKIKVRVGIKNVLIEFTLKFSYLFP